MSINFHSRNGYNHIAKILLEEKKRSPACLRISSLSISGGTVVDQGIDFAFTLRCIVVKTAAGG